VTLAIVTKRSTGPARKKQCGKSRTTDGAGPNCLLAVRQSRLVADERGDTEREYPADAGGEDEEAGVPGRRDASATKGDSGGQVKQDDDQDLEPHVHREHSAFSCRLQQTEDADETRRLMAHPTRPSRRSVGSGQDEAEPDVEAYWMLL